MFLFYTTTYHCKAYELFQSSYLSVYHLSIIYTYVYRIDISFFYRKSNNVAREVLSHLQKLYTVEFWLSDALVSPWIFLYQGYTCPQFTGYGLNMSPKVHVLILSVIVLRNGILQSWFGHDIFAFLSSLPSWLPWKWTPDKWWTRSPGSILQISMARRK